MKDENKCPCCGEQGRDGKVITVIASDDELLASIGPRDIIVKDGINVLISDATQDDY